MVATPTGDGMWAGYGPPIGSRSPPAGSSPHKTATTPSTALT
jgi:hypothetical protein